MVMVKLEEKTEVKKPCSGACDKINECKCVTTQCRLPIDPDFKPKQPLTLSVPSSKRWMMCYGWAETIGLTWANFKVMMHIDSKNH